MRYVTILQPNQIGVQWNDIKFVTPIRAGERLDEINTLDKKAFFG